MKQIIAMRTDLNMRKGKMIAQGAHASMGAVLRFRDDSGVPTVTCCAIGPDMAERLDPITGGLKLL